MRVPKENRAFSLNKLSVGRNALHFRKF